MSSQGTHQIPMLQLDGWHDVGGGSNGRVASNGLTPNDGSNC